MALDRTVFNTWVDDTGLNLDGTPFTKAQIAAGILDPIDAQLAILEPGEISTTLTGTGFNFTLGSSAKVLVLRCNNAALLTITGFAGGAAGRLLAVLSVGAGRVDFTHEDAGSTAANRLTNYATSAATSLAPGTGTALYAYDATSARWRLVGHDQGAWITPTFAAGNYTGNGSMTWTVAAGDVQTNAYRLSGRELSVSINLQTTTVGGTPNTTLQIAAASMGGFNISPAVTNRLFVANDAASGNAAGIFQASGASITLFRNLSASNWSASTDSTYLYLDGKLPVS